MILELHADPATPAVFLPELLGLIAARRNGTEALLAALSPLPSPRAGPRAAPVAALAEAFVALQDPRAAPLLANHLTHPYSPPATARAAAQALRSLATPAERGKLEELLALNRCVADDDDLRAAVVLTAAALVRVGGSEAARLVKAAASDPLTVPAIREQLASIDAGRGR